MLVRSLAGHGARALLSAGLTLSGDAPEELITRAIPVFLEHYADNICTFSAPYPGLELALEELRIEGFRLAICTNKPEGLANHLVEALGRSEEHTSELQSLTRNSYAIFCLNNNKFFNRIHNQTSEIKTLTPI